MNLLLQRRILKQIIISILVGVLAGCSSDDAPPAGDGGTPDATPSKPLEPYPIPFVIINNPAGATHLTTDQAKVTLGGVSNQVTQLVYEHASGEPATTTKGTISVAPQWKLDALTLTSGDNTITVLGRGPDNAPYSDNVTFTYNPGFKLDPVKTAPRELDQGGTDPVLFSIKVHSPTLLSGAVELFAVDAQGKLGATALGALNDAGQNGDLSANDGIYSARVVLDASAATTHQLRLSMGVKPASGSTYDALSEIVGVEVLPPFTAQDSADLAATISLATTRYAVLIKSAADKKAALTQLAKELQKLGGVKEAVVGQDGDDVWWTMSSGVNVGFADYPEGSLGGGGEPTLLPLDALIVEPYRADLDSASTLIPKLGKIFDGFRCPRVATQDTLIDKAATLEQLMSLHKYSLVAFTTHGGVVPNTLMYGKARGLGTLSVLTTVDLSKLHTGSPHWQDVLAGRLLPLGNAKDGFRWAVTSRFFEHYLQPFAPGSLVHVGACSSAQTMSLARAFFKKGVAVYSGFTNTVRSGYATSMGLTYFDQLKLGKTVQGALIFARNKHGWHDPGQTSGKITRLVSVVSKITARAGVECDGFTELEMSWVTNTNIQRASTYYSLDLLEFDPGSGGRYFIKEAHKSCTSSWKDPSKGSSFAGNGSYHDIYASYNSFNLEKRSTITKLEIDRVKKTVKIVPVPLGADFDDDAWVIWDASAGATSAKQGCYFSGEALGLLTNTAFDESQVEFGNNYVKGSISFDYAGDPHMSQAKGSLEFYYDVLPLK